MIDLNIPDNIRKFRKLKSKWPDTPKELLFEVIERKRCEKCLKRLIIGSQRKGFDNCVCDIYEQK